MTNIISFWLIFQNVVRNSNLSLSNFLGPKSLDNYLGKADPVCMFEKFDSITRIKSFVLNMQCFQYVLYSLFSLQKHRVCVNGHQNNLQTSKIIPRRDRAPRFFNSLIRHCLAYLTSWCLQFSLTPEYVLLQSLLWNVNCQSYTVVDTCTCTLYIYMLNKKHWCTHQIYGPKKFPRGHHKLFP